jgi:N-acetylmuramoyl-L-alanine amidase
VIIFKTAKSFFAAMVVAATLSQFPSNIAQAASYRVQQGDSIFKISQKFNVDLKAIMKANNLQNDLIYPGQVLDIPSKASEAENKTSFYVLAKKFGIPLEELKKINIKWNYVTVEDKILNTTNKAVISSAQQTDTKSNSEIKNKDSTPSTSKPVIPYTSADLDLLARLITAEAENQPYNAKVAVGAVIINRVLDPRFPNSIKSVIYQVDRGYYQFTPVLNGYINKPASKESKKAALEALQGKDPTNGAVYYFDDSTKNKWLLSRSKAARIGRMIYTY